MKLRAFADELEGLGSGRQALVKLAGGIPPITTLQMGAIGAGSGLAGLGLQKLKHTLTGDPYDEPIDSMQGATLRGALGGLTVAGVIKLLAKAAKR